MRGEQAAEPPAVLLEALLRPTLINDSAARNFFIPWTLGLDQLPFFVRGRNRSASKRARPQQTRRQLSFISEKNRQALTAYSIQHASQRTVAPHPSSGGAATRR